MFAMNEYLEVLPFTGRDDTQENSILTWTTPLDMSSAESMICCFYSCKKLIAIGVIYFGETDTYGEYNGVIMPTSKMINAFAGCPLLEYLIIRGKIKVDSNDLSFIDSPNLRNDCAQTILEALKSNVGEETQYTVYFHENVYNELTDEQKAIATNKNILLSYTK